MFSLPYSKRLFGASFFKSKAAHSIWPTAIQTMWLLTVYFRDETRFGYP